MTATSKQKKRICKHCGQPKPVEEFVKGSNRCLECRRQYFRVYKQLSRAGKARQKREACLEVGLETWGQVDSVIREMAESQFRIQKEHADLEKRIALLKKYTDETVEPELIHQITFQSMLRAFLKKTCSTEQAILKRFDFGVLRFHQGKLAVELDAARAGQRMGKP
jgi:predicted  nucleic acid-binding Zn-ribbon protein